MIKAMAKPIEKERRVTAIALIADVGSVTTFVNVTVNGKLTARNYSHIISTMPGPLSCLHMVDTTQCGFDWTFQTAIRNFHYESSVKVVIMFASRWWEDSTVVNPTHTGGVSSTDRPTRTTKSFF